MTGKERSKLPIHIKSDELSADNRARIAVFTGKVSARQGDVTILSDKLVVRYNDDTGGVDQVEALGNVRVLQKERTAFAARALYDNQGGWITLTGDNPRVFQGDDMVTGEVITYYIDEDRSVVVSGPKKRVEMTVHPDSRKKYVK